MLTEKAAAPKPRRSRAGPALVVLLVLYSSLYALDSLTKQSSHSGRVVRSLSAAASVPTDTDTIEDLTGADMYSKAAFVYGKFVAAGGNIQPSSELLKPADEHATRLVFDTQNSPGAARRLITVRALLGYPPLAPVKNPDKHASAKTYDPLDAFGKSLPADASPAVRAEYARERSGWAAIFGPHTPTDADVQKLTASIGTHRDAKWWRLAAGYVAYRRSANHVEAQRAAASAAERAEQSIVGLAVVGGLRVLMFLVGAVMLIGLLVMGLLAQAARSEARAYAGGPAATYTFGALQPGYAGQASPAQPGYAPKQIELWPVEPDAAPVRRLQPVDLLNVFLVYLVTSQIVGFAFGGYPGVGANHILSFHGLLQPFRSHIAALAPGPHSIVLALIIAATYLVSGAVPIALLVWLARRRGASLGAEVGLTRRKLLRNLVYGVAGFCISQPIMIVVAMLAKELFQQAPAPSNPVIPIMMASQSWIAQLILGLVAAVAAPVVEETLFRGVLLNAIKPRLGGWPAIILSGLVFGFMHPVGVAEKIALASLGMVFAWMAETRKSLAPSMVAHGLNNGSAMLLLRFVTQ